MFKTVILGCENSHANSFLKAIKEDPAFSDIEVIGVYSDETDRAEALKAEFGVEIMKNFDDACGKVDGVIITARHGDNHLKYAMPYIADKVPFFIDKPFTICPEEGEKLCALLEKEGCKFTGGSSLKHCAMVKKLKKSRLDGENGKILGGHIRTPIDLSSPYGGFYFYAQHLVEILIEGFGEDVKSVIAKKNSAGISVLFRYDEFDVSALYAEKNYIYSAVCHTEKVCLGGEFPLEDDCFKSEFSDFAALLTGGSSGETKERMMKPVYVMNAVFDSLNNDGKETSVR